MRRAEIADLKIESRLHLAIGVVGEANRAGLGDAFQSRGDIDAIAHQVAVRLLDHVAEVNANSKHDAALRRKAGVALDHAVLHLNGAADGVHNAAEFDQRPIACALDDATVMHGDGRVDEVAAERPQAGQGAILVRAGKPAEADDIRGKDGGKFPALGHSPAAPTKIGPSVRHGAAPRRSAEYSPRMAMPIRFGKKVLNRLIRPLAGCQSDRGVNDRSTSDSAEKLGFSRRSQFRRPPAGRLAHNIHRLFRGCGFSRTRRSP